jgi:hypothetical protein
LKLLLNLNFPLNSIKTIQHFEVGDAAEVLKGMCKDEAQKGMLRCVRDGVQARCVELFGQPVA